MKKGKKDYYFIAIIIGFLMISSYIIQNRPDTITGNTIYSPLDCSETQIKATWDSIFKEESGDIVYVFNDTSESIGCNRFYAIKNKSNVVFIMYGFNDNYTQNQGYKSSILFAKVTEFQNAKINITNLSGTQAVLNDEFSSILLMFYMLLPSNETKLRQSTLSTKTFAKNELNFLYKIDSSFNMNENNLGEVTAPTANSSLFNGLTTLHSYNLSLNRTTSNGNLEGYSGIVYSNISVSAIFYVTGSSIKIEPNNTQESVQKANVNLNFKINGSSYNETENYSGSQKVNITHNNKTLIEFDWDFSKKLNFSGMQIFRQSLSSSIGYLIVNGINVPKIVYVDKLVNSSNSVCVKNSHINTISNISIGCNLTDESIVSCPRTSGSIICSIIGNQFKISGINNSAVKEIANSCQPNWDCTDWSDCESGLQQRTCTDSNFCGINSNKPVEFRTCIVSCSTNWSCTSWSPEECPKNQTQTRVCIDTNSCGTNSGKPNEKITCVYEKKGLELIGIILIIIISLVLIGTLIGIIIYVNKKRDDY